MNKAIIAGFIALVVAASGCADTTDNRAAAPSVDHQDLKEHVTEENSRSATVTKYVITDIDTSARCVSEKVYHEDEPTFEEIKLVDQAQLYERSETVQKFREGLVLVENGLEQSDVDVYCGENYTVTHPSAELNMDTIEYRELIYQEGTAISNSTSRCGIYARFEAGYRNEEDIDDSINHIYDQCFEVSRR